MDHFVEGLEDLRGHVRRQIPILSFVLLHFPVRRVVLVTGGRCGGGAGLVLTDLLVVAKQVIPLVVALVLAAEAAVAPAVVLNPFPPELAGSAVVFGCAGGGIRGGGAGLDSSFVVELLCRD